MEQTLLDECLNPALRAKIKKLVELNLDSDSIWDLLDPNLKNYEEDMYSEVEKYVKYVLWLRETDRSLENAYEKYKNYTQTFDRNFKRDLATRLELEQKRKDQQRIDELSALMKYSRQQKAEMAAKAELIEETKTIDELHLEPKAELINEQEAKGNKIELPELNDEINDEVNEDTESDLDFIDLATNQANEPSITLNTKDLLFETMTNAMTESSELTVGIPLEAATVSEEKTLTIQAPIDNSKTNEALAFYNQLETKYGDKEESISLATYALGSKVNYKNEEYLVIKIETIPDFFDHPEIIITLKNIKTEATIHVNHKQIESQN